MDLESTYLKHLTEVGLESYMLTLLATAISPPTEHHLNSAKHLLAQRRNVVMHLNQLADILDKQSKTVEAENLRSAVESWMTAANGLMRALEQRAVKGE